jgi:penicillin-binding protein 2
VKERSVLAPMQALFALITLGLVYTQIVMYAYYSKLSKDNAIRIVPIAGPRGTITDRNGAVLANDRISFNAAVVYQELRNREKLIRLLSKTLGYPREKVEDSVERSAARPYAPVVVAEDIDSEKAFLLEEESFDIRGLSIETRSVRNYPLGNAGAHVLGYLSEITERELEDLKEYGYRPRDLIGRDGVEKYYDKDLAGSDGGMQIQIDNKGRQVGVLGYKEPGKGKDISLTIDAGLQRACDKALEGRAGAIIVMDPGTGEVLALSSSPSYDPNIFINPEDSPARLRLLRDKARYPLLNRAVSGVYPPGSVFKIVTACAALQLKRAGVNTSFNCGGYYTLGASRFDCWKEGGHGRQTITDALMNSCNVFFYNIGRAIGVDSEEAFARIFGFGRPTGIDLPDEAKGIVPGRLWKKLYRKDAWYEGDTINYAIGQGYVLATPIQVLEMMAVMANNGYRVRPHVIRSVDSKEFAVTDRKNAGLKDNVLRTVREGLYRAVNSAAGTGKRAAVHGITIAGKTGTAQNPLGRTHAWFSGFAPFDEAKICLIVFLEHGGKGGLEPSEIAKTIFEEARKEKYL